MVGDVLVTETVLQVGLQTDVSLQSLEVRNQVCSLGRYLVVLLHNQLVLYGVEVQQLNFRETKTAECFEHKIRDELGDVVAAHWNSLGHYPS